MNSVFGPVPSRRLGRSLGIDPIPLKTCNWNCVYCQLGRTRPLVEVRKEYIPRRDILNELEKALAVHQPGDIDWITFVGSGEPTLHTGLGWLIRQVKSHTDIPVAVITNGSLLIYPDVREDLLLADAVLPSLDAGSSRLYRRVNRPMPRYKFEGFLRGLSSFRQIYSGQLWVEVMLLQDLNDSEEALKDIAAALVDIQPDQVHLNVPVRPPAEAWVSPASKERVTRALEILGSKALVVQDAVSGLQLAGVGNLAKSILGVISRHPMDEAQLLRIFGGWPPEEVLDALASLEASGQATVVERYSTRFWTPAGANFPTPIPKAQ